MLFKLKTEKIILAVGWISISATIRYEKSGYMYAFLNLEAIRDVYLFFGISGFVISILILILDLLNVFNVYPYNEFPINDTVYFSLTISKNDSR